jgi:hypothetical protein
MKISKNWAVALIILAGLAVYVNTFANRMFWDDNDFILHNDYVQNWKFFGKFFSENVIAGAGFVSNYWRPFLLAVFSLEYHFWGNSVYGYHIVNLLFHIAAAILLYEILRKAFKSKVLAFFTALVFVVHPLQTEAVTYVSGLGDSLSAFFMFWAIWAILRLREAASRKGFYFGLSILMSLAALLSKESAVVLPGLLALVVFFAADEQNRTLKDRFLEILKLIWPFALIIGIYIGLRATVLNFQGTFNFYLEKNDFSSSIFLRLLTFFRILMVYFKLLVWPHNLHMERTVEIARSIFAPDVLGGAILTLGLLILGFWAWKRLRQVSFGIFWFFAALFPMSNIMVPINGLLYEHWMYLPLIGIFFALAWSLLTLAEKWKAKTIIVWGLVAALACFAVLSIKRNRDWRDPISFYKQTLAYAPQSYRLINNLGMEYANVDQVKEAEETYLRAIAADDSQPVAYHNLANLYLNSGDFEKAEKYYALALERDPDFVFSATNLIGLYGREQKYDSAKAALEKYFGKRYDPVQIYRILANLAVANKNEAKALEFISKALELNPDDLDLIQASINLKAKINR